MAEPHVESETEAPEAPALTCDFCGQTTDQVRRIALDRGYDRLRPHAVRYACAGCSETKERERAAEDSSAG